MVIIDIDIDKLWGITVPFLRPLGKSLKSNFTSYFERRRKSTRNVKISHYSKHYILEFS